MKETPKDIKKKPSIIGILLTYILDGDMDIMKLWILFMYEFILGRLLQKGPYYIPALISSTTIMFIALSIEGRNSKNEK